MRESNSGWLGLGLGLGLLSMVLCFGGCPKNSTGGGETCGDGEIGGAETCDDGNTVAEDGCSDECLVEAGWSCDATSSHCAPICGDGLILGAEECDGDELGNETCASLGLGAGTLDCAADCTFDGSDCGGTPPGCGNDLVEAGEECDDGNTVAGDGCGPTCLVEVCGNRYLDPGETCDDGNNVSCDGCRADCSDVESGCGDGYVCPGEACDDGNNVAGDGCSPTCLSEGCGNGEIDTGEECDDGNTAAGDGCGPACLFEECGNSYPDPGEVCDDGNTSDCDGCRADCSAVETGCGDGFLCGAEACDDGDNVACDGCSAICSVESCGNGVQECAEACDAPDLDGETCGGLGHDGGTLGCDANCGYDEGLCVDCVLPEIFCAGGCVDPRADDDHCGGCNAPCGAGSVCVGGNCEATAQAWTPVGANPIGAMATPITAHDLVTDGALPTVAYVADLGGPRDVHVAQFDSAAAWIEFGPQPSGPDNLDDAVSLAFDGATYYIAYAGGAGVPWGSIHVKVNGGIGWLELGAPGYPSSCGMHWFIDLALNGAEPHLTSVGAGGCGIGIEYAWYDGTDWLFRPGGPMPGEITMNGAGNPAILYTDQAYVGVPANDTMSGTAVHSVKFWDSGGGAWDDLDGLLNLNAESGWDEHLAMVADPAGDLWVAWVESDGGAPASHNIYVKHHDQVTGIWTLVGAGEINGASSSTLPSITLIGGVPWVAYVETANSGIDHIVVRRYNTGTSSWQPVGPPLNVNVAAHATYPVIAGLAGVPYVAFREEVTGPADQRLYVKTFP